MTVDKEYPFNDTKTSSKHIGLPAYYTLLGVQTTVGIITVIGNLLLASLLHCLKTKYLKKTTRLFLIYASLSHIGGGLLAIARPHLSGIGCTLFSLSALYSGALVISGMHLLALDSLITLRKPYTHHRIMTLRTGKIAIGAVILAWASFIILIYFISASPAKDTKVCSVSDGGVNPKGLAIFCMSLITMLMLTTIVQLSTIVTLKQNSAKVAPQQAPNSEATAPQVLNAQLPVPTGGTPSTSKATRQGRLLRLLTFSIILISICWYPMLISSTVASMYDIFGLDTSGLDSYRVQLAALVIADGVVYPFLTIALSSELRTALRNKLCILKPANPA